MASQRPLRYLKRSVAVSYPISPLVNRAAGIGWYIVGREPGPGARPCNPDWNRSLVKQCQAAGVPAFVKKLAPCGHDRSAQTAREGIPATGQPGAASPHRLNYLRPLGAPSYPAHSRCQRRCPHSR
ncbi:MAG: DUF5131 family protein [Pseudonocardiaceae bacterium]